MPLERARRLGEAAEGVAVVVEDQSGIGFVVKEGSGSAAVGGWNQEQTDDQKRVHVEGPGEGRITNSATHPFLAKNAREVDQPMGQLEITLARPFFSTQG